MILKKNIEKTNCNFSLLRSGKLMLMLGVMLMLSVGTFAQDTGGDGSEDPDAPFDGGISLLVAAGVAYGAKQWRNGRKGNKEENVNTEELENK